MLGRVPRLSDTRYSKFRKMVQKCGLDSFKAFEWAWYIFFCKSNGRGNLRCVFVSRSRVYFSSIEISKFVCLVQRNFKFYITKNNPKNAWG